MGTFFKLYPMSLGFQLGRSMRSWMMLMRRSGARLMMPRYSRFPLSIVHERFRKALDAVSGVLSSWKRDHQVFP